MLNRKQLTFIKVSTTFSLIAFGLFLPKAQAIRQHEQVPLFETDYLDSLRKMNLGDLETQILAQQQAPRVALVIGNSAYSEDPLKNPVNDATDLANALQALGFDVTLLTNLNRYDMDSSIRAFVRDIPPDGEVVFYYAGHGVQVDGENFLIPTDAGLEEEADAAIDAISLSDILKLLEGSSSRVNVVIVDACRDNPFYRRWRSVRGGSPNRGLAPSLPSQGTIISFATEPGGTADDGDGRNSPYTASLLKHIYSEGEDVATMFRKVRADVIGSTDGYQVPWYQEALIGSFSFNPEPGVVAVPMQAEQDSPPASSTQPQDTPSVVPTPPVSLQLPALYSITFQLTDGPTGAGGCNEFGSADMTISANGSIGGMLYRGPSTTAGELSGVVRGDGTWSASTHLGFRFEGTISGPELTGTYTGPTRRSQPLGCEGTVEGFLQPTSSAQPSGLTQSIASTPSLPVSLQLPALYRITFQLTDGSAGASGCDEFGSADMTISANGNVGGMLYRGPSTTAGELSGVVRGDGTWSASTHLGFRFEGTISGPELTGTYTGPTRRSQPLGCEGIVEGFLQE
jgi:hypothetical protein